MAGRVLLAGAVLALLTCVTNAASVRLPILRNTTGANILPLQSESGTAVRAPA